jgi:predicted amidohydrolase
MTRIAGAQIPVTKDIYTNVKHIKTAIDWANKNKVDFLLTPEGSLSGYMNSYEELERMPLIEQEIEIVKYAAQKGVGLVLGTEYIKNIPTGKVKVSQVRYYNDSARLIDAYDKQMVIPAEYAYAGNSPEYAIILDGYGQHGAYNFKAGTFICNDVWGQLNGKQIIITDLMFYKEQQADIIFHASNGFRGSEVGDEYNNIKLKEYADINLWMHSRFDIPIVTVDNCYKNNGDFYDGPTSSTSGIILNGEWLVKAADSGTDYFYYDFNF